MTLSDRISFASLVKRQPAQTTPMFGTQPGAPTLPTKNHMVSAFGFASSIGVRTAISPFSAGGSISMAAMKPISFNSASDIISRLQAGIEQMTSMKPASSMPSTAAILKEQMDRMTAMKAQLQLTVTARHQIAVSALTHLRAHY
jgi:hypothetical protein